MTKEAALDQFAFMIAYRLMGSDERRRLYLSMLEQEGDPSTSAMRDNLRRVDKLISGRTAPESEQDRYDMGRALGERRKPQFDESFWALRTADLSNAGFDPLEAKLLVANVRQQGAARWELHC